MKPPKLVSLMILAWSLEMIFLVIQKVGGRPSLMLTLRANFRW